MSSPAAHFDVVVIGAGLAGPRAATLLEAAGLPGLHPRSPRGGRREGEERRRGSSDEGARSRVHRPRARPRSPAGQRRRLQLVDSALYRGPFYWRLEDGRKPRRGYLPPLSRSDWVALLRIGLAAARQARRLDPIAPWLSPEAAALDQLTAAEWLRCNS